MTSRIGTVVLAVLLGAIVTVAVPASAGAAPTTETVQGRYLRIDSTADWRIAAAMGPGDEVRWDLAVSADAPSPGSVRLGVSATGAIGLDVDVRLCGQAWQGETCPTGARTLRTGWPVPLDGRTAELDAMPADAVAHLRIDVRVPATDEDLRGSTEIRVHADGFGDSIETGPGASAVLSATGGSMPVALVVVGGVLVGGAVVLLLAVRWRKGGEDG